LNKPLSVCSPVLRRALCLFELAAPGSRLAPLEHPHGKPRKFVVPFPVKRPEILAPKLNFLFGKLAKLSLLRYRCDVRTSLRRHSSNRDVTSQRHISDVTTPIETS